MVLVNIINNIATKTCSTFHFKTLKSLGTMFHKENTLRVLATFTTIWDTNSYYFKKDGVLTLIFNLLVNPTLEWRHPNRKYGRFTRVESIDISGVRNEN